MSDLSQLSYQDVSFLLDNPFEFESTESSSYSFEEDSSDSQELFQGRDEDFLCPSGDDYCLSYSRDQPTAKS
ncbi:hypothetical protein EON65_45810, partial [archaeon]